MTEGRFRPDGVICDGLVVVTAPWCHHCRAIRPYLEVLAAERPPATFQEIDASLSGDTVSALGVRATPTFLLVRDGKIVGRHSGAIDLPDLRRLFSADGSGPLRLGAPVRDAVIRMLAGSTLAGVGVVSARLVLVLIGVAVLVWAAVGYRAARR